MTVQKIGLMVDLTNKFLLYIVFKFIIYIMGGLFYVLILISCQSNKENNANYHQGEPVILKKEYSLIPTICMYTYEGYGRKETFEDKCNKYSVGDKLGGNTNATKNDTLKIESK
ncbi:hypothetical protein [Psychroflexus salis]|uniref:Uncharacterized protein n=1 Tax=Psychroflexus salis TaxID=1526574 RepID=A0A916ZV72_9FLAO|nr:hypothetical protein [Psychroflexus salis]GGE15621.1 hypothetical protein GCM10010831_16180 [Psychroflexus salis]